MFFFPDDIGFIGIVEPKGKVVAAGGVETINVIKPLGNLQVTLGTLGTEISGESRHPVLLYRLIFVIKIAHRPQFQYPLKFEDSYKYLFGGISELYGGKKRIHSSLTIFKCLSNPWISQLLAFEGLGMGINIEG
jgi:hypothetical protein